MRNIDRFPNWLPSPLQDPLMEITLKITPEIVVPVFLKPGGFTPLASRKALRAQRSKSKPPVTVIGMQVLDHLGKKGPKYVKILTSCPNAVNASENKRCVLHNSVGRGQPDG